MSIDISDQFLGRLGQIPNPESAIYPVSDLLGSSHNEAAHLYGVASDCLEENRGSLSQEAYRAIEARLDDNPPLSQDDVERFRNHVASKVEGEDED